MTKTYGKRQWYRFSNGRWVCGYWTAIPQNKGFELRHVGVFAGVYPTLQSINDLIDKIKQIDPEHTTA